MLLCESDGTPAEVAEEIGRMKAVLEQSGATSLVVSQNEAERLRWAGRKAAFPAVGRITPDYLCMDGTIPRKRLAEMLEAISDLSGENMGSAAPTSSMPATATCTPDHVRRQPAGELDGPPPSVPKFSNFPCGSAAPSPASTALASKRST